MVATNVTLSGADLIVQDGKYYAEAGKTITATVTLTGAVSGTNATVTADAGTSPTVTGTTITGAIVSDTDEVTIAVGTVSGTITFTFTTNSAVDDVTVTIS